MSESATQRPKYLRTYGEYAKLYDRSERQIKRWARRESDRPPLDSSALMASWWTRNFQIRVPSKILAYATAAHSPEPAPDKNTSESLPVTAVTAPTLAEGIEELRRNVELCRRELATARASGDAHRTALCNRGYALAFETLLKAERLAADLAESGRADLSQGEIDAQIAGFLDKLGVACDYMDKNLVDGALRHAANNAGNGKQWIKERRHIVRSISHYTAAAGDCTKQICAAFAIACRPEPIRRACRKWLDDQVSRLDYEEKIQHGDRHIRAAQPQNP